MYAKWVILCLHLAGMVASASSIESSSSQQQEEEKQKSRSNNNNNIRGRQWRQLTDEELPDDLPERKRPRNSVAKDSLKMFSAVSWRERRFPPTLSPTISPSDSPSLSPSSSPSGKPSARPSRSPTSRPSQSPSESPSSNPSSSPSVHPTNRPTTSEPPSQVPSSSTTSLSEKMGYYRYGDMEDPIRIACVGDSLTRGVTLAPPSVDYPKQLQGMLGDRYTHRNLGVNALTAIRGISLSYTDRWAFRESLSYQPHIYLIMFGTNDSRIWETHGRNYRRDMEWIIKTVRVETGARIIVAIPPYVKKVNTKPQEIRNDILVTKVRPALENLAKFENVELVDMYAVTVNATDNIFASDDIHLNEKGYRILAAAWKAQIQCNNNGICDIGENCNTCPDDCYINCR